MEFNELIKKRASIRKYSHKKIQLEKVMELIEAANLAPSPGNLEILRFIVIEDKEKIEKISEACQQRFIKEAPILVIVCSEAKKTTIMYEDRADKYIKQHAGAAIENFLLKITNLGLASCWIGAFSDLTVKNILEIPDKVEVEAILSVAYQDKIDKTKQKPKPSLNNRIFFNTWKNKFSDIPTQVRREDV